MNHLLFVLAFLAITLVIIWTILKDAKKTRPSETEYEDIYHGDWVRTSSKYIWFNAERQLYTLSDETSMFSGLYKTEAEATKAMEAYSERLNKL